MNSLLQSPFLTLFGIIALGALVGSVRIRGTSLGAAGVFFVAMGAGHVLGRFNWTVPHELTELGLVLFVYAVGLQAGPRFFGVLRTRGAAFLTVGLGATLVGAVAMSLWPDG